MENLDRAVTAEIESVASAVFEGIESYQLQILLATAGENGFEPTESGTASVTEMRGTYGKVQWMSLDERVWDLLYLANRPGSSPVTLVREGRVFSTRR